MLSLKPPVVVHDDPAPPTSFRTLGPGGPALAVMMAVIVIAGLTFVAVRTIGSGGDGPSRGIDAVMQSPGMPKPDFTLTDTSGHPFDLDTQTAGYVTLLYFGYTHCPDICPTHMANIAIGLEHVPAAVRSHIKVVFVTTDPKRDTRQVLRSWLDAFSPTFIGLTGTDAQIDAAEASVGMPPAEVEPLGNGNYSVDHAAWVIAFTPDNLAHFIYPSGLDTGQVWTHDLPRLVRWPA